MFRFVKSVTVPSNLIPGIEYVFRRMTENRRLALLAETQSVDAKLSSLYAERKKLEEAGDHSALVGVNNEIRRIHADEATVLRTKWALKEIKGLELEGENGDSVPATPENVLDWPSEIVEEMLAFIEEGTALGIEATKNSVSPSTSGAVADGATNNTTAPVAAETAAS